MDTKNKKLYMVSLGPGDIDLLTIKALDSLKNSDVICVPTKSKDGFEKSLTKKIIDKLFEKHNFKKKVVAVYTPMHFKKEDWQYQVDILYSQLDIYDKVSFVTLGDAAVYSTVYYLLDIIKEQKSDIYNNCEVIAGVTSFSHASAKVKKPLCVGDSSYSIVPLLDKEIPNTTIYMRPKIGMDTSSIEQQGNMYTFENLNYSGEKISNNKIAKVNKYMTLFIDFFKKD